VEVLVLDLRRGGRHAEPPRALARLAAERAVRAVGERRRWIVAAACEHDSEGEEHGLLHAGMVPEFPLA
jgi:hypothetical protein